MGGKGREMKGQGRRREGEERGREGKGILLRMKILATALTVTANCGQYNKVIGRLRAIFADVVYLFSVFLKHFCLMRVLMYSPPTH